MNDEQSIQFCFNEAIEHLGKFLNIPISLKEMYDRNLEDAINTATFKLLQYRSKYGVGMEKEELLREIVFLGTSLAERHPTNPIYYKATVKACASLVEILTKKTFDINFISKLLKANSAFQCNQYFSSETFYFIFKTHFKIN